MTETRDRLIDHVRTAKGIPVLPESLTQLITIQNDPNSGLDEAIRVLRRDPGIAANVLRLANSARFGTRNSFSSLESAAAHLGLARIAEIAMVHTASRLFDVKKLGFDAHGFWRRSIVAANMAQVLMRMLRPRLYGPQSTASDCFTAGLLHDIGILVLVREFPDVAAEVVSGAQAQGIPLVEEERRILETDHQVLGGLLCERWKLPTAVTAAARYHHDPEQAQEEHQVLVAMIHVANHVAINRGFGYPGEVTASSIAPFAWNVLGLDLDEAGDIIREAETAASNAEALL
jgi:HD-like signal output (HDOD) protein